MTKSTAFSEQGVEDKGTVPGEKTGETILLMFSRRLAIHAELIILWAPFT